MFVRKIMKYKTSLIILLTAFLFLTNQSFGQKKIADFYELVETKIGNIKSKNLRGKSKKEFKFDFQTICPTKTNFAAQRVFEEYGAIFAAESKVALPTACIFEDEVSVQQFQNQANPQTEIIGRVSTTLQTPAMNAFLEARKEAAAQGLTITPRGTLGSKRSYSQTLSLWNTRFYSALDFWARRRKITPQEAQEAREMPISRQVERVLLWEEDALFFSKDFRKSILHSVAVPGASQHIFLIALDVYQFGNPKVREILAKHGWFQTVKSDAPHFTYLGVSETELPALGLRAEWVGKQKFWVPDLVSHNTKYAWNK